LISFVFDQLFDFLSLVEFCCHRHREDKAFYRDVLAFLKIELFLEKYSKERARKFFGKSRPFEVIRRKTKFFLFKKFANHPLEAVKG